MTPQQIITAAQRAYNAVGDNFWSQDELLTLIYLGSMELFEEGLIIERTYSTSTVVSQQEYDFPTGMYGIKRIDYDGQKLNPITFDQDDEMTGYNSGTTETGTPLKYMTWNETILLRPIPSDVATLEIRGYVQPSIPTINSVLEIPTLFHPAILCYVTKEMIIKDSNGPIYDRYEKRWERWIGRAVEYTMMKKVTDKNPTVKPEQLIGRRGMVGNYDF